MIIPNSQIADRAAKTMIDPQKIWTSKHLPSLPTVAVELLNLTKDPDAGISDIVSVVKTDPAISAKILKVVNSTFFGVSSRVTSIERAVSLLGGTYVTSVALSFYLAAASKTSGPIAEHYSQYWLQSVVQATAAEQLGRRFQQHNESELFLSGLMLDLGRLAMLKAIPDEYSDVIASAVGQPRELCEIERESFGFDHAEIGGHLAESWRLPESLRDLIRYHHTLTDGIDLPEEAFDRSYHVAMVVASCVGEFFCGHNLAAAHQRLKDLGHRHYGMDENGVEEFLRDVHARIVEIADQFSVEGNCIDDPAELMADASTQLSQMVVRENVASLQATARHQAILVAQQELESQHQLLQQQSYSDRLTSVYNRDYFEKSLDDEVARCVHSAAALGLIFCDIDRFKQINDNFGHPLGDLVLTRIASAIQEVLRPDDILARFGGDEFVVLVRNPTVKGLEKLSERMRQRISEERITCNERQVEVTASFGAALDIPGRNGMDVGTRVIAAADHEMYQAKRDGGNCCRVRSLLGEFAARVEHLVNSQRFSRWLVAQEILDIASVSQALLRTNGLDERIGQLAVSRGALSGIDIQTILAGQAGTGLRFGEMALELGLLSETQLVDLLILQKEDPQSLAHAIAEQKLMEDAELVCALEAYKSTRSLVMRGIPSIDHGGHVSPAVSSPQQITDP